MILETIEKENDIKNVPPEDWNLLAEEIREEYRSAKAKEQETVGKTEKTDFYVCDVFKYVNRKNIK